MPSRRQLITTSALALATTAFAPSTPARAQPRAGRRPNVVLIYLDDLGYGDLGSYGSSLIRTPRLDRLARQGTRFTQGYSGAPVCTPSRAALLTGRVPPRSGLTSVLDESDTGSLPIAERTIADYFSDGGYHTALIGKWHLGRLTDSNPIVHGFTEFFGLDAVYTANTYPIDLWRNDGVIETIDNGDQLATLTARFTDEAIAAIDRAADQPFYVQVNHIMPHLPIAPEPRFAGRSKAGPYGDVIEALDHHIGRLLDALDDRHLARDTIVIVASDNGPWFQGSVGGLRGRKFDVFEGGMRVPFIVRWPHVVPPARTSDDVVSVLDLLPTLCAAAGVTPEPRIPLDGTDITRTLRGENGQARKPIYYFLGADLAAVRDGEWKLHVRRRGSDQRFLPELYHLADDPNESYDVSSRYPQIVAHLQSLVTQQENAIANEPALPDVVVGQPALLAGRTNKVPITIIGAGDTTGVVQVTPQVPNGWGARPLTTTVDLATNPTVEIEVTPPGLAAPEPGLLPLEVLKVAVTVNGAPFLSVASGRVVVVPDGAGAVLALDAGPAASRVQASYQALTPAKTWTDGAAVGWIGTAPGSRDRAAGDDLRRDIVTATAAATLRLRVPGGTHTVSILRGDIGYATVGTAISIDGSPTVAAGPEIGIGEFAWDTVIVDGGANGRTVDLGLASPTTQYWKVAAVLVH